MAASKLLDRLADNETQPSQDVDTFKTQGVLCISIFAPFCVRVEDDVHAWTGLDSFPSGREECMAPEVKISKISKLVFHLIHYATMHYFTYAALCILKLVEFSGR